MKFRPRQTLRCFYYGIYDALKVAPLDYVEEIEKLSSNRSGLKKEYESSNAIKRPDTFVLYRIIGNDLPPRHKIGQSIENVRFILDHEPEFPDCEKRFVLNRILHPEVERELIALLEERGIGYLRIPFVAEEYAKIPLDLDCLPHRNFLNSKRFRRHSKKHQIRLLTAVNRYRNNYVMHNNGARNAALLEGKERAKWVLPFDGNCFLTMPAWEAFSLAVIDQPWFKYFVVPMARINDNEQLLDPEFRPEAKEEPQLAFRFDSQEIFNEAFPYGRFPKIEMFWRLGIPGAWSRVSEKSWDPSRRSLASEAGQFALAGWVARLFSGVAHLEAPDRDGPSNRGVARREAILSVLGDLDEKIIGKRRCDWEQVLKS